ncbi:MAG: hypothetical protein WA972_21130 [Rhodococcus qingshengii]
MSDSKPYRDGPISYTPTAADIMQLRKQSGMPVTMCRDALAAEAGHQERAAEWLRVESANRWPDGGPRRRDIDCLAGKPSNVELVEAGIPALNDNLTFTAHRWLKGDPIPYDEMRRLCGLDPAVKAYCARRDIQRSFSEIGKAMNQVATEIGKGFERFADALTASKPKTKPTPPMWADDPSRQRRPTKTRNHRRVK